MKIKTHKTSSKRFSKTGSGKFIQTNIKHQHLRHRKSSRMLASAKGNQSVDRVNVKKIRRLVPYL